jgi:SAM-dependent methyltransferase
MARNVTLARPDPSIHPVGKDHSGTAAQRQRELLERCGLRPSSQLLEIGCGIGRLVYEIAGFLDEGRYAGFDISPEAIAWLNENYAPALANFRFDLVEVRNARYRPQADAPAEGVRLPYDADEFDFACAFSVFTHMQLPDIEHYLGELRRVLEPGGRGVMTFFTILAEDTEPRLRADAPFLQIGDGVWTTSPKLPERAIAFDVALVEAAAGRAGLRTVERFPGTWHRWTENAPLHKDVYVLTPD